MSSSDVDRRVTFDRAVWTKPLAFAADAGDGYARGIVRAPGVGVRVVTMEVRSRWSRRRRRVATGCSWTPWPPSGHTSGARAYERD
jgi:hypothetical protein